MFIIFCPELTAHVALRASHPAVRFTTCRRPRAKRQSSNDSSARANPRHAKSHRVSPLNIIHTLVRAAHSAFLVESQAALKQVKPRRPASAPVNKPRVRKGRVESPQSTDDEDEAKHTRETGNRISSSASKSLHLGV